MFIIENEIAFAKENDLKAYETLSHFRDKLETYFSRLLDDALEHTTSSEEINNSFIKLGCKKALRQDLIDYQYGVAPGRGYFYCNGKVDFVFCMLASKYNGFLIRTKCPEYDEFIHLLNYSNNHSRYDLINFLNPIFGKEDTFGDNNIIFVIDFMQAFTTHWDETKITKFKYVAHYEVKESIQYVLNILNDLCESKNIRVEYRVVATQLTNKPFFRTIDHAQGVGEKEFVIGEIEEKEFNFGKDKEKYEEFVNNSHEFVLIFKLNKENKITDISTLF